MNCFGADQAALGIVPADQGLDADDQAAADVAHRLVVQHELVVADGVAQAGRELQLIRRRAPLGDPAAAAVLAGTRHGAGGLGEQRAGVVAVGREDGHAGRDADVYLVAVDRERRLQGVADVARDGLGELGGVALRDAHVALAGIDVGEQHEELVAGLAADDVGLAGDGAQPVGDPPQELVADLAAEAIVHERELVDVDEHDRDRRAVAGGAVQRQLEVLGEHREVGQLGQRVVGGEEVEPLGDGAQLGHVDEREQRAARAAVDALQRGLGHDHVARDVVSPDELKLGALAGLDLSRVDEVGDGGVGELGDVGDAEQPAHGGIDKQGLAGRARVPQADRARGERVEPLLGQVGVGLDLDPLHELGELVADRAHQLEQGGVVLARRAAEELDHAERAALEHEGQRERGVQTDVGGVSDPVGAAHGGDVVDPHRAALGPGAAGDADADLEGRGAGGGLEGGAVDAVGVPHGGAHEPVVGPVDRPQRAEPPAEAVGQGGEDLRGGGVDVLGGQLGRGGLDAGELRDDRDVGLDRARASRTRSRRRAGRERFRGGQIGEECRAASSWRSGAAFHFGGLGGLGTAA